MQKVAVIGAVLLSGSVAAHADEASPDVRSLGDSASPSAKIDDVGFLSGHWVGTGLGGCAEEIMVEPAGGHIMGMFRQLTSDGAPRFYEFYTIAEEDGSLTLRIKHFNPDMTGWEEKTQSVAFRLVAIEGTTAYFDGLTFSRRGEDGFQSAVIIGDEGVETFAMRQAKAGEACGSAARP